MGKFQLRNGVTGRKKTTTGSKILKCNAARTNTSPVTASGKAKELRSAATVRLTATPTISHSSYVRDRHSKTARVVTGYSTCFSVPCSSCSHQHLKRLLRAPLPAKLAGT